MTSQKTRTVRSTCGNGTGAIRNNFSGWCEHYRLLITAGINQLQIGEKFSTSALRRTLPQTPTPKVSGITVLNIDLTAGIATFDTSVTFAAGDIFAFAWATRIVSGRASEQLSTTPGFFTTSIRQRTRFGSQLLTPTEVRLGQFLKGLILKNVDGVRTNGAKTSLLLTSLGVRRSYFNLLVQQRQYVGTKDFTGGFTGLAFTTDQGDIPLISDVDAPPGTIYGLSEKNLKVYREADWSFMDRDGSMWDRVPGKDAYAAMLYAVL